MSPDEQIQRIVRLATKNPPGTDGKTCKIYKVGPMVGTDHILDKIYLKECSALPIQYYFTISQKDKLISINTMNIWLEDIKKRMIRFKYGEDCYKIESWKFYVDDLTSLTSKQINGTTLNKFYESIKSNELDSANEAFFVSWMRSIFREIKTLHPSIPTIFTDDSIPIPSTTSPSTSIPPTKSLVIIHCFPGEDITKKEYYMKPENNGKYIYIITSAGSTIADSTNPLKTLYPNLFDEANIKSDTTHIGNPYNGESYIKSYYDQKYGLKNGFYKEVIDLIESQPIKATIVDGHSITKSYPAGSVFYIQNNVPIQDDIRIRGIFHIKGINFTGRSDQLKLKSYSYINTYYSRIFRHLIESSTKDIVIHLTAVPDDEITYRAIAAAVDTQLKIASSDDSSIQFNLPMSADDYNKYIAMGPPIESTQVDPTPDKPIETRIAIPTAKCGKIKGTGGTTIKMLASLTLAEVTLKGCNTRSKDGTIIINGRKKDVDIVEAKVNELLGKILPPTSTPPPPSRSSPTSTPLTREKIAMAAYTKEMSDRQAKYDAAIKDPDPVLDTILMSINTLTTDKERAMIKRIIKVHYYKNEPIPENIFDTDIENRKKNEIMKLIRKLHPDRCSNQPFCELLFKKANPLANDYYHGNTRQIYTNITTDIIKNYIYKECQFKTGDKVFVVPTKTFGTITSDPLNNPSCSEKSGTTYNITYEDRTKRRVNESDLFKYDPAIAAPTPSVRKGGVRKTLKHPRQRVHAPKRKSLRSSRRTLATDIA
jgi:hypothetical protein